MFVFLEDEDLDGKAIRYIPISAIVEIEEHLNGQGILYLDKNENRHMDMYLLTKAQLRTIKGQLKTLKQIV